MPLEINNKAMNETLAILGLGAIQGLTEFLPISSSMHLVLMDHFVWAHDPLLDVAVHLGSLFAVVLVFWREVFRLVVGASDVCRLRITANAQLLLLLMLATTPVVVAGFFLDDFGWDSVHQTKTIGAASLGFGLLLWAAERWGQGSRRLKDWRFGSALAMGMAQIFALIPGASRSGVTMTAALTLGFSATEAARIALLMSVPVIAGAAALKGYQLIVSGDFTLSGAVGLAMASSFVVSLAAIPMMLFVLRRIGYVPFILYRCVLGGYLLLL